MLQNIVICVLAYYTALIQSTPLPTTSTCKDPTNLDAMWTQLQQESHQNLIVPVPLNEATNLKQSYENGTLMMGDKFCPKSSLELQNSKDSSLIHRSTCPYYYVMEIDSKRYPPAITEARCRCDKCLEKSGHSEFQVCEPVTLPIKVLRNSGICVNGVWEYRPVTHQLQFSCTCAVQREQISSVEINNTSNTDSDGPPTM